MLDIKEEFDNECINPEILNAENEAGAEIIPEKSKKRYYQVYEVLLRWQELHNSTGEFSDRVLLEYFKEQSATKKPTTLWSTYSMLRSVIKIENKVDISKNSNMMAFIRNKNKGYEPEKTKVFEEKHIAEFFEEAPDDDEWLPVKATTVFGILGACTSDEQSKALMNHIEYFTSKDGEMYVVHIPKNKTSHPRSFTISEPVFVSVMKNYLGKRPEDDATKRVFLQMRNNKCINNPIGKNSIYKHPKKVAAFLNLPDADEYSGHSFRKISPTTLVDIIAVKRHGKMIPQQT